MLFPWDIHRSGPCASCTSLAPSNGTSGRGSRISVIVRFIIPILLLATGTPACGQTGPGGVGNGTTNVLWLRGDNGVNVAGSSVVSWNDRSGGINNATSPSVAARPTWVSSALNGYPMVIFDGVDDQLRIPDAAALDLSQWSIFMVSAESVAKNNNAWLSKGTNTQPNYALYSTSTGAVQMPIYTGLFLLNPGSAAGTTNGSFNLIQYDNIPFVLGTRIRQLYKNGSSIYLEGAGINVAATNNNQLYIGNIQGVTTSFLSGAVAEVIIYNGVVNAAQRLIINNYLAAKYGTTLTTGDAYAQDLLANGNYDHDVAGIGRVSASDIQADSRGTGVVRINSAAGLGNNEFLLWGHDNGTLGAWGSTDLPPGLEGRWHRVWRVNEVSSTGTAVDVGTVNITFDLTGQGPVTASHLRLLVDANNNGIFADDPSIAGAAAVGGNDYRFTAVSALVNGRRFTLGTTDIGNTPLPVQLVEFSAQPNMGGWVDLRWITATEHDNEHFTVQRSADGIRWDDILRVPGAGNSSVPKSYGQRDMAPLPHLSYYRLMQTDHDRNNTWGPVVVVNFARNDDKLLVFPNPARNEVNVVPGPDVGATDVQLINELGQSFKIPTTWAEGRTVLDVSSVPSGLYLVVLTGKNEVFKRRLIIAR